MKILRVILTGVLLFFATIALTQPTLSTLTISSNNANNNSLAKNGDVVTVLFTASEALFNHTVTIGGRASSITNVGLNYSATLIINGSEPEGVAAISLYYEDALSNSATSSNADITDASSVTFDFTAPILNPLSISSNNANNASFAKTGDIVTVLFTANEALAAMPTATIGGRVAAVSSLGGLDYNATLTIDGTEPQGNAIIALNYADASGNGGSSSNANITNGSSVTLDFTQPSLNPLAIGSNNANTSFAKVGNTVTISFTSNELLNSPSATIGGMAAAISNVGLNYTATRTVDGTEPQGLAAIVVNYTDVAGNAASATNADITNGSSVTLDFITPVLNPVTISSNNANNSLARVGNVVTVLFTSNETLSGTTATIGGLAAIVSNLGGTNYSATRSITGTEPEGVAAITINYSDAAGNSATATNAAITNASSVSLDFTNPTLNPLTISSNNANTSLAKNGDIVTVSFSASETLSALPTATIGSRAATVTNTGGLNYTATLTINGTEPQGIAAISINFSDAAGNAGSATNANITNGSSVTLDFTVPTLNPLTIISNNASTSLAKSGNTVTISFTADDVLISPTATIGGQAAAISNVGLNYTVTRIIDGTEPQGVAAISINYSDAAGNTATATNANITNGSSVTLDFNTPVLNPVTISSNNANNSLARIGNVVTVLFTSNETLVGTSATIGGMPAVVSNLGGANYSATRSITGAEPEGVAAIVINFSDATGNTGTALNAAITNASSVSLDFTNPTLTPLTITSNNANTSLAKIGDLVTVSFTASETLLALPTASIAGRVATVTNTGGLNYTATLTINGTEPQGVAAISINYVDAVGNAGSATNANITNASSVTLDFTAPTLNPLSISSNNANPALAISGNTVTVSFTADDVLVAPSATIGGAAASISNVGLNYTATRIINGTEPQGIAAISINYTDAAGNAGSAANANITDASSVTLDFSVPVLNPVTISSNNANPALAIIGDVVTLSFTSNELLYATSASIGGRAATITNIGLNYSATRTIDGTETEGLQAITINYSDQAGNTGSSNNADITDASSVTTDFTLPTLNPLTIISNNVNSTSLARDADVVTIAFTASETLAALPTAIIGGQPAVVTNTVGLNYTATRTADESETEGLATFSISYSDPSGNPGTSTNANITNGSSVVFDFTPPANQNTVFSAGVNQFGGTAVSITSSGLASNKVWFAPIGQTMEAGFVAGATMTKAVSGTSTSILAPANAGNYYIYIIDQAGNVSSSSIAILTVVNTPVLNNIELGSLRYIEGDPATQLTNTITVQDDLNSIASATIQITGNFQAGEDVLAGGAWNAGSGTLTIAGPMTKAAMQAALRTVTYQNTSATPSNLIRTLSFTIYDGAEYSNTLTRTINLTPTLSVPGDNATIQAAITAAINGDRILVTNGTYIENINFAGKQIEVIGNVSNPGLVVIDGGAAGSVVTFNSGETNTSILKGFTIQNGSGTLADPTGVYAPNAYYGGGVYCNGASPVLEDLIISGNNLPLNGNVGASGAGIYLTNGSNILLRNSTISNNNSATYRGGGVVIDNSNPVFDQVVINNNSAGNYGGGLSARNAFLTLNNVTITNNNANGTNGIGGGMYLINSTHTITGLTINGNSSTLPGNNVCTFNTPNVIPLASPSAVKLD